MSVNRLHEDSVQLEAEGYGRPAQIVATMASKLNELSGRIPAGKDSHGRIVRKGIITAVAMVLLSLVASALNAALGAALLFLTIATLLVFAYAYWAQTQTEALHPRLLLYGILLSLGLAFLALASLVFT